MPSATPSPHPGARPLDGRRVLITGVSRGIGLECARLFLQSGARIIGAARDAARLAAAAQRLAPLGEFHPVGIDLARPGCAADAVAAVDRHFAGALDVLVNNAGVMVADESIAGEPAGSLEQTLQVNVVAVHNLTRALLPALLRGREPRIINTSSGAGNFASVAQTDIGSYRVSKFALNGLTLSWAAALRGRVAVNAFDPGWVRTDMGGPRAPGAPTDSARGALALATLPAETTGRFWKDGREIPW